MVFADNFVDFVEKSADKIKKLWKDALYAQENGPFFVKGPFFCTGSVRICKGIAVQEFDLFSGGAAEEAVLQSAEQLRKNGLFRLQEGIDPEGLKLRCGSVHIVHVDREVGHYAVLLLFRLRGTDELQDETGKA